ncbi:MAG: hypothetical protein JKX72_10590 [Robiginitomaculum sp.]|nr:hypothetical protein [Robiginitomaculum sp.]
MKRLHIHVNADETKFDQSVGFYSTLFGEPPTKTRHNYAKRHGIITQNGCWMTRTSILLSRLSR